MPSIPNLPTDNLYKFSFLGGLTIIIVTSFLYFTLGESIKEKTNNLTIEISNITSEKNILDEDLVILDKETKELKSETAKVVHPKRDINQYYIDLKINLKDKNYRDYVAFISEYKDEIFPEEAQFDKLVKKTEQYKIKKNQNILNVEILKIKNKHIIEEIENMMELHFIVMVLYLFGMSTMIYGLYNWIAFQNITDKKNAIELSILKLQLSKMESDELNH